MYNIFKNMSMYKIDKAKHLWFLFTKTNFGFWADFMLISQLGEQHFS